MQLNVMFLAAVLLMLVLIALVVIILRSLSVAAGIRIRSDMLRMLNSYDRILDEKSKKLLQMQEEAEALEQRVRTAAAARRRKTPAKTDPDVSEAKPAAIPQTVSYRLTDFGSSYSAIKNVFRISDKDKETILRHVRQDVEKATAGRGERAAALRQQLDFDLVFRMAQLSGDEQLELLRSSLGTEDLALLQDYRESSGETFDVTKFVDWLGSVAAIESVSLEVLDGSAENESGRQSVVCEGIRVYTGSRLYDYSIGDREIG